MDYTSDTGDRILDLISQLRSMLNQRGQKYSGGSLYIDIPEQLDERTRVLVEFYLNDTQLDTYPPENEPYEDDFIYDKYNPQNYRYPYTGGLHKRGQPIRADTTKITADTTGVSADNVNSVVKSILRSLKEKPRYIAYV